MQRRFTPRALLWLLLAALSACAAERVENPFHPEGALVTRARRLLRAGDDAGAERVLRSAMHRHPRFVPAHRTYQNLLEAKFRRHEVLAAYDSLLNRYPRSAAHHYLRGRVAGEQDGQLAFFRRAASLDPDFFWGRYGLGFVYDKMGYHDRARAELRAAARLNPRSPLPHMVLGNMAAARMDFDEARARWAQAARLDPENPQPVYRTARSYLLEGDWDRALTLGLALLRRSGDSPGLFRLCRKALKSLESPSRYERAYRAGLAVLAQSPSGPLHALVGFAAHRLGHRVKAREHYDEALALDVNPMLVCNDQRLLLVELGHYDKALACWKKKVPLDRVLSDANTLKPRFLALEKAAKAAAAKPRGAPELHGLGRALRGVGWVREAMTVYRTLAAGGKETKAQAAERKALEKHITFQERLARFFRAGYRAYMKDDIMPDLADVLERVGRISIDVLGKDLGAGNAVSDFSFIGSYVDPSKPAASPLAAYFRSFNQYFILGRRGGRAPEATLMSMTYLNPAESLPLGDGLEAEVVFGETFEIDSFGEYGGRCLLGVALYHGFHLNLDALAEREFENWRLFLKYGKNPGDLANFQTHPRGWGEDVLAVDEGRGLRILLLLRAYADRLASSDFSVLETFEPGRIPAELRLLTDGTFFHEAMHVADARRYLPVGSNPISALGLALREGFSGTSIEAVLEENAGLASLALSGSPGAELASMVGFLPYPRARLPHSQGFYNLVKALLRHLVEHSDDYEARPASIDFSSNVFRQLHKLSADQIRAAARSIVKERGLFPPPGEGKP